MTNKFETISVIGLGYIGLPVAVLFASHRKKVVGFDINPSIVNTVRQGKSHFIEPNLDDMLHVAVKDGYLRATSQPEPADVFIIAVPTPLSESDKPDLSYVKAAASVIAPMLAKGNLVILESTSPVGTTLLLANLLAKERHDLSFPQQAGELSDIRICYCPERACPGNTMNELINNKRIFGGITPKCSEAAKDLYRIFSKSEFVFTDSQTAEMCKLTENTFRDINIAFANELSMICDQSGIDVLEVIRIANMHPRVNILEPGPGVGGHCIAIDPWFIVDHAPDHARLIRSAREVNLIKSDWVFRKIQRAIADLIVSGISEDEICIACFGVSYKPDIDDIRESPALKIIQALTEHYDGNLVVIDPNLNNPSKKLEGLNLNTMTLDEAITWAHIVVLLVDHTEFKSIKPKLDDGKKLIDIKGIWRDTK